MRLSVFEDDRILYLWDSNFFFTRNLLEIVKINNSGRIQNQFKNQ